MVTVDNAGGNVLYGQGFYEDNQWKDIARGWDAGDVGIMSIPLDHYRVLKLGEIIKKGDARNRCEKDSIPIW
jgi:hypothetical protein